jgi:hypothetical protein
MSNCVTTVSSAQNQGRTARRAALPVLLRLIVCALMIIAAAVTHANESTPPSDSKCIKCHSRALKKSLENGEILSLQVATALFEQSAHSVIGCTGCHRDTAKGKHPSKKPISSEREYSRVQNETCRQCHAGNFQAYEGSIHASLVDGGDAAAPLCSDCHNAHAVQSMAVYEPVSGKPCKTCHEEIYDAYAQSVHGMARANGNVIREGHIQAPICADCHSAHDVNAVAAIDHLQTTCLDCHDGARQAHGEWLPNAEMHMNSVSCAACHSPVAERRIDLLLYDNLTQVPVGRNDDHEKIQGRLEEIDSSEDGLDPLELWKLVRTTSKEGQATDVTLRGRMEVTRGVDAHRLAPRADAVRSCDSCHQGGAEAFQNVTVSISRPDGRKQHYEADRDVLSSAISVDSVGGFYAPGGTRIKLLDGLLALAIVGGLAIPIGHMTLGKFLRKKK